MGLHGGRDARDVEDLGGDLVRTPSAAAATVTGVQWFRAEGGPVGGPDSGSGSGSGSGFRPIRLTPVRPFPEALLMAAGWASRLDSTTPPIPRRAVARILAAAPRILVLPLIERRN